MTERIQPAEGRVRRLATPSQEQPPSGDFRSMVTAESAATAAKPVSGWAGLVTARVAEPASAPAAPPVQTPTAESVFGPNPWQAAPSGQGPLGVYYHNPIYFASATTAAKVAEMMGGRVVERDALTGSLGSPFQQQQPNYMVELPSGSVINPGLVAAFYTHGYSQSFIDGLLRKEAGPGVA